MRKGCRGPNEKLSEHGASGELVAINLDSDESASGASLRSFGGGGHIVVHVVVMMMVVMMVMSVMMHLMPHRGGRRGFLRDGVASEADRESGGGDKALDHGQSILR